MTATQQALGAVETLLSTEAGVEQRKLANAYLEQVCRHIWRTCVPWVGLFRGWSFQFSRSTSHLPSLAGARSRIHLLCRLSMAMSMWCWPLLVASQ